MSQFKSIFKKCKKWRDVNIISIKAFSNYSCASIKTQKDKKKDRIKKDNPRGYLK